VGNYGIAYIHTLNRNMQAVKTFINNHLQSIGRDDVIFSLYTIANEIGVLIKHLDDGTFQSYAEELHIDPPSSVISALVVLILFGPYYARNALKYPPTL